MERGRSARDGAVGRTRSGVPAGASRPGLPSGIGNDPLRGRRPGARGRRRRSAEAVLAERRELDDGVERSAEPVSEPWEHAFDKVRLGADGRGRPLQLLLQAGSADADRARAAARIGLRRLRLPVRSEARLPSRTVQAGIGRLDPRVRGQDHRAVVPRGYQPAPVALRLEPAADEDETPRDGAKSRLGWVRGPPADRRSRTTAPNRRWTSSARPTPCST